MYGNGLPILILHGVFGMSDNWHTLAKRLAEKYWVIIPDLRNHGRSGHSDIFDYEVMAGDIKELLEENHIRHCNIIGHSMGGKLAMNFALEYPEYVDNLLILDIGVKKYESKHEFILNALQVIDPNEFSTRESIVNKLSQYIHNQQIVNFLLKNISLDNQTKKYNWKFNLKSINNNFEKILEPVFSDHQCIKEILFIRGMNSDYILDEDWNDIIKLFPNAKLETIPNSGHWLHSDQPEILYNLILDYIG